MHWNCAYHFFSLWIWYLSTRLFLAPNNKIEEPQKSDNKTQFKKQREKKTKQNCTATKHLHQKNGLRKLLEWFWLNKIVLFVTIVAFRWVFRLRFRIVRTISCRYRIVIVSSPLKARSNTFDVKNMRYKCLWMETKLFGRTTKTKYIVIITKILSSLFFVHFLVCSGCFLCADKSSLSPLYLSLFSLFLSFLSCAISVFLFAFQSCRLHS